MEVGDLVLVLRSLPHLGIRQGDEGRVIRVAKAGPYPVTVEFGGLGGQLASFRVNELETFETVETIAALEPRS